MENFSESIQTYINSAFTWKTKKFTPWFFPYPPLPTLVPSLTFPVVQFQPYPADRKPSSRSSCSGPCEVGQLEVEERVEKVGGCDVGGGLGRVEVGRGWWGGADDPLRLSFLPLKPLLPPPLSHNLFQLFVHI